MGLIKRTNGYQALSMSSAPQWVTSVSFNGSRNSEDISTSARTGAGGIDSEFIKEEVKRRLEKEELVKCTKEYLREYLESVIESPEKLFNNTEIKNLNEENIRLKQEISNLKEECECLRSSINNILNRLG